jgi:hypothetical protein
LLSNVTTQMYFSTGMLHVLVLCECAPMIIFRLQAIVGSSRLKLQSSSVKDMVKRYPVYFSITRSTSIGLLSNALPD